MANTSLYTLAQTNGSDVYTGIVEDYVLYTPEYWIIPAVAHAGTSFQVAVRTGLPNAQFRLANQALTGSSSTYKQLVHQMSFIDCPIVVDEMVYNGSDQTAGDLIYNEAQGALQSVAYKIANQFYYGAVNDGSNGFVGIRSQLLPTGSTITAITASNTNPSTTVYGLWLNPQGASFAVGKMGAIDIKPITRQWITTGTSNASNAAPAGYWGLTTNVSAYVGAVVNSEYSVFGCTGVTQAAPFTDKLGIQLVATVPLMRRNGFTWFMNRLAYSTLQQSRTSITYQPAGPTGTPAVAPPPIKCEGYDIVITDAISNTENNS
jgi:hypothetical protein